MQKQRVQIPAYTDRWMMNRFTCAEIERLHSKTGFEVRTMDERVEADQ
jgi:hypothetical protein